MPRFECLYAFSHPDIDVIEIKRLDLPEGSDVSKIYHWLALDNTSNAIWPLEFKAMTKAHDGETRTFSNGSIAFDEVLGKFQFQNKEYTLKRYDPEIISSEKFVRIGNFLNQ